MLKTVVTIGALLKVKECIENDKKIIINETKMVLDFQCSNCSTVMRLLSQRFTSRLPEVA